MATKKKLVTKKTKLAATKKHVAATKSSGQDFLKVDFNLNTVYWLIIGVAVISTALITYSNHQRINEIYDSIERTEILSEDISTQKINPLRTRQ